MASAELRESKKCSTFKIKMDWDCGVENSSWGKVGEFGIFAKPFEIDEPFSFSFWPDVPGWKGKYTEYVKNEGGIVVKDSLEYANIIRMVDIEYFMAHPDTRNLDIPKDSFSSHFIGDTLLANKLQDLNKYRMGGSVYEPYDANEILVGRKSWKDLVLATNDQKSMRRNIAEKRLATSPLTELVSNPNKKKKVINKVHNQSRNVVTEIQSVKTANKYRRIEVRSRSNESDLEDRNDDISEVDERSESEHNEISSEANREDNLLDVNNRCEVEEHETICLDAEVEGNECEEGINFLNQNIETGSTRSDIAESYVRAPSLTNHRLQPKRVIVSRPAPITQFVAVPAGPKKYHSKPVSVHQHLSDRESNRKHKRIDDWISTVSSPHVHDERMHNEGVVENDVQKPSTSTKSTTASVPKQSSKAKRVIISDDSSVDDISESDGRTSCIDAVVGNVNNSRKRGPYYSAYDSRKMVRWVCDNNYYEYTRGNKIWQKLENEKTFVGRTWQGLREHFNKKILPNVCSGGYGLNEREKHLFKDAKTVVNMNRRLAAPINID